MVYELVEKDRKNIRFLVGDKTAGKIVFSDDELELASEMAQVELSSFSGISVDGGNAGTLLMLHIQTAILLLDSDSASKLDRPVSSASEGGTSVSFVDIGQSKAELQKKLNIMKIQASGCIFDASGGNY